MLIYEQENKKVGVLHFPEELVVSYQKQGLSKHEAWMSLAQGMQEEKMNFRDLEHFPDVPQDFWVWTEEGDLEVNLISYKRILKEELLLDFHTVENSIFAVDEAQIRRYEVKENFAQKILANEQCSEFLLDVFEQEAKLRKMTVKEHALEIVNKADEKRRLSLEIEVLRLKAAQSIKSKKTVKTLKEAVQRIRNEMQTLKGK